MTERLEDIPVIDLPNGLEDGTINLVSFDKKNNLVAKIDKFDEKYEINAFTIFGGDFSLKKQDEGILPNLSKLDMFRIELHNPKLSPGAILKINDDLFGEDEVPDASQLYTTSSSDDPDVKELKSLIIAVAPAAIANEMLRASDEECVAGNKRGPQDAIRDGAFTVKILDVKGKQSWELVSYADGGKCKNKGKGKGKGKK